MSELLLDGQNVDVLEPKRPESELAYTFRVDGLSTGENITNFGFLVDSTEFSATNTSVNGLTYVTAQSNLTNAVTLTLKDGTLNSTYRLTFWYTTSEVPKHGASVKLPIRNI